MMLFYELGAFVKQWRGTMSIRRAAAIYGISPTTLCRIEAGDVPDFLTAKKICDKIGLSIEINKKAEFWRGLTATGL